MDRPLYNQLVRYYEVLEGRDWKSEIDLITSVFHDYGCNSVVDLGCGTGHHVRSLARSGFKATGVDISVQNVSYARKRAAEDGVDTHFVVGSYYEYHPVKSFDAALCLNWSIPVKDGEVRRFLNNTYSLLRPRGVLIFDYEKVSEIAWSEVGKPIFESWDLDDGLAVRVSVGQIKSNVLSSRDVYIIYPKRQDSKSPDESSRYKAVGKGGEVQIYRDHSYVRFFSPTEIRCVARDSGFSVVSNLVLPRRQYKRNYAILRKAK